MNVLKYTNSRIPCIKASSASVTSSVLTVTFPKYSSIPKDYSGPIFINIPVSLESLTFTSVIFATEGLTNTQALTTYESGAVSSNEMPGSGIYLAFYDKITDVLLLI